jgi:hypothetical protein
MRVRAGWYLTMEHGLEHSAVVHGLGGHRLHDAEHALSDHRQQLVAQELATGNEVRVGSETRGTTRHNEGATYVANSGGWGVALDRD